ncbi:MAG: hypothetical protein FH753_14805 [Firmicutes bacterium]|nr:hypothetical protein [Bacillota bacterium]
MVRMERKYKSNTYNNLKPQDYLTPYDYAAIYARKSIKKENNSIPSQIEKGKEVLYKNNLVLYKAYYDSESAYKYSYDKRNGFMELLNDMENNKFKTIVVLKRDRLSRKFEELLEIRKKIKEHDVKVIYSGDGEFQPDKKNIYSDFIEYILMGVSDFEVNYINERASTGRKMKHEEGRYSKQGELPPFGFTETDIIENPNSDYQFVPHEKQALVVKNIFNAFLTKKYSIKNLTNYAISINNTGRSLNENIVRYMITNPLYAAIQRPAGDKVLFSKDSKTNCYHPIKEDFKNLVNVKPIIDENTFTKVALKYLNNKRNYSSRKKNYLFKGLLACTACNKNINLSGNYYRCNTKSCSSIREDLLLNTLLKRILNDIYDENTARKLISKRITDSKRKKATLNKQLQKNTTTKQEKLLSLIKKGIDKETKKNIQIELNEISKIEKQLIDKITLIEGKISSLNALEENLYKLRKIGNKSTIINFLKNDLNTDEAQDILKSIIEKVYIDGKSVKEIDYGAK